VSGPATDVTIPARDNRAIPPPRADAWGTVLLFSLAFLFSVLDRLILNLLAPEIKIDLGLSDLQLSYLQGFFFVILYVGSAPTFGWMADRWRRNRIAAMGIALWSLATASAALATSYSGLALSRLGVGLGEAALGPAATSLISDLFPPEQRARALSVYSVGPPIGSVLALLAGPLLIPDATLQLPLLGWVKPWQATFLIVGLPGLLIALAVLRISEPKRSGVATHFGPSKPTLAATTRFVGERIRAFSGIIIGSVLVVSIAYGVSFNVPLFLYRTFHWTRNETGLWVGLLNLFTLVPAGLASGILASRLRANGRLHATYLVMTIGSIGLLLPATFAWLMPNATLFLAMLALSNISVALVTTLIPAVIADVTPNQYRGQITAWYLLTAQLVGAAIGPIIIASMTQYLFGTESSLKYSLTIFGAVVAPLAAATFLIGYPAVRKVTQEAISWQGRSDR
jgi:MFS family permease